VRSVNLEMQSMNSYELSRSFTDWAFENPEKIKPIHYAIYFFAIEHCNRLGWKTKFGLPSQMVMESIGVKNWKTYSIGLNDLVEWGFICMVEVSKNQYSSNIISLSATVKNTKADTKALDKALSKHSQKQGTKQGQSTVSIDKQLNNITSNKEQRTILMSKAIASDLTELNVPFFEIAKAFFDLFEKNANDLGVEWLHLKKITADSFTDSIRLMSTVDNRSVNDIRAVWEFLKKDEFWKPNIQSSKKLREKFDQLITKSKTNGNSKTGNGFVEQAHAYFSANDPNYKNL
jgi:hypothetical protein